MKPEYLAEIERMRLMDDDKAEEGRHAMCETMEKIKAEGKAGFLAPLSRIFRDKGE